MVFLEPSILQAESPQLLQPVFRGEVFQLPDRFHGCPLDLLQQVPALNVGSPRAGDCVYTIQQENGSGPGGVSLCVSKIVVVMIDTILSA